MSELLPGLDEQMAINRAIDLAWAKGHSGIGDPTKTSLKDFSAHNPLGDLLGQLLQREVEIAGLRNDPRKTNT